MGRRTRNILKSEGPAISVLLFFSDEKSNPKSHRLRILKTVLNFRWEYFNGPLRQVPG